MNIGYIHLDYGEWTTRSYNIQEIGLAKALEQMGHLASMCITCKATTCFVYRKP